MKLRSLSLGEMDEMDENVFRLVVLLWIVSLFKCRYNNLLSFGSSFRYN